MKPVEGYSEIKIPVTLDTRADKLSLKKSNFAFSKGVLFFNLLSFIFFFVFLDGKKRIVIPLFVFFVSSIIIRYIIVKEHKYKRYNTRLVESDYTFDSTLYWDIARVVGGNMPYVVFKDGGIGVFVALDKDIIVGKPQNTKYSHHEAVTSAYRYALKTGMTIMHVDYMGVVGKDERFSCLYDEVEGCDNPDVYDALNQVYAYIQSFMNVVYTSYDVYVFYSYKQPSEVFVDLREVLKEFMKANYARYTIMDKEDLPDLVKEVYGLGDFSLEKAMDLQGKNRFIQTKYLTPIWTEKNGERTVLNKTQEDKKYEKGLKRAEGKARFKGKNKRKLKQEEIDIFNVDDIPIDL